MRRTLRVLTAIASSLFLITACGAPRVYLNWYDADPTAYEPCVQLVQKLPGHLLDQGRRELSSHTQDDKGINDQSKSSAVWGDPVISLVCGTVAPPELRPDSQLIDINGIAWFALQTENGFQFWSNNLKYRIRVNVPHSYAPETNVLVELSSSLSQYIVTN